MPEAWHAGCDEDSEAAALATIGSIWARQGEEQEALAWFSRAAELTTGPVGRAHVGALLALAAGHSAKASEHLESAGGSVIALNLRGEEHARAGDRISAARFYAEALRRDPDHFDATPNLRALGAGLSFGQLDNTGQRFPG